MSALLDRHLDIARRAECVRGDETDRRSDVARRGVLKLWPRTTFARFSASAFCTRLDIAEARFDLPRLNAYRAVAAAPRRIVHPPMGVVWGATWREAQFCYEPDPALMCQCRRGLEYGEIWTNSCSECGRPLLIGSQQ